MKPALDGLLVVDLSSGIAGPYAAMLLTDMGAECVKIEPGGGDQARCLPGFHVWNRGKKGITLNLEFEEGREILYRLLERADVFIESYSPRQAKLLGLDYDSLSKLNPQLIYCAIPIFGESGPLSEKTGNEGVVSALAGIMSSQGGIGHPPVFVTLPLASYGTAFLTAYGAMAALYVRETSGTGQKVEVSLLSGALAMQASTFVSAETIAPTASRRSVQQGLYPAYRLFQCQDEWLFLACGNPTFWNKLCITLDRIDLISDPRFEGAPWAIADEQHRETLTSILEDIIRQQPRDYWLRLFESADIPCAPVSRREEFMEDPQVQHNRMIVSVNDPKLGTIRQMGMPITIIESPTCIKGPAPILGEHTQAILKELGYDKERISQLKNKSVI